jgi:RNA polymerase sigma-70 factor (ECF subfamily)
MADILKLPDPIPDERLRLLFTCCHPALGAEVRAALALKVICGLPVAVIARLFVVSEQAMFQRITCAKLKVREAGIAFELSPRRDWPERLGAMLLALRPPLRHSPMVALSRAVALAKVEGVEARAALDAALALQPPRAERLWLEKRCADLI